MDAAMIKLFNMSLTAVWLILAVIILRLLLKKSPKYINLILWAFVGFRLVCPFNFESVLSLIPSAETIPSNIQVLSSPAIDTGFNSVNEIVNPVISDIAEMPYTSGYNPIDVILRIAVAVWIAGIVLMFTYSAISYLRLHRTVKASIRYNDNIYLCDNIKSPFILGITSPRIFLPSDITDNQINHVIAHEKAHIRRFDHILKPLGFTVLSIHWFNPFVWLAYSLFCRDIEYACDEKVIKAMQDQEKKTYSETLLSLSITKKNFSACPLAFGETGVKSRIKTVLSYKKPALWIIIISVVALFGVAIGFMTSPENSQINGKVYAPKKFYHSEVIGADRANNERKDIRYHISEDFVLSMYYDDGLNYQINHQGHLKKQEQYDSNLISLIIEKLPSYYNDKRIKEVYIAENDNDLTEPKDLYVLLKYTNGDLILSYMPSGSGEYYVMETLKIKALPSKKQLDSRSFITGTKGSTDCDGVTVKIIEAVYFSDNPYVKIQWQNNTGDKLISDSSYSIFRHENGKKVYGFEFRLQTTPLLESNEENPTLKLSLEGFDFSKTGIYSVEIGFGIGENTNTDKYTAVLEFEIADTPSFEPVSTSDPSVQPEKPISDGEYTTKSVTADNEENVNPYFDAKILEVNEKNILVEPFEGEDERKSASKIYVSTDVISTIPVPELKKGDEVRIVYNGEIQETYPAGISNVFAIYSINE